MESKDLRGMECFCENGNNIHIRCYVAVADRDIGITIKRSEDDEDICCLNREELFEWAKDRGSTRIEEVYNTAYNQIIADIENFDTITNLAFESYDGEDLILREATREEVEGMIGMDCPIGG